MGSAKEQSFKGLLSFFLILSVCTSCAVVCFGASLNNLGIKYSRVTLQADAAEKSALENDCPHEIFTLSDPDSRLCCDGLRRQDWACVAAFDYISRIMTSLPWSYILPIVPWICTTLFSKLSAKLHFKRLFMYVHLFIFRLVVLYLFLNSVQGYALEPLHSHLSESCWYSKLRKCSNQFDFSDHIVLFLVNFLFPIAIESSWIIHEALPKFGGSVKWIRCVPTLICSLLLSVFCFRSMMFTALYFHTPAESIAALVIVAIACVFPMCFYLDKVSVALVESSAPAL